MDLYVHKNLYCGVSSKQVLNQSCSKAKIVFGKLDLTNRVLGVGIVCVNLT